MDTKNFKLLGERSHAIVGDLADPEQTQLQPILSMEFWATRGENVLLFRAFLFLKNRSINTYQPWHLNGIFMFRGNTLLISRCWMNNEVPVVLICSLCISQKHLVGCCRGQKSRSDEVDSGVDPAGQWMFHMSVAPHWCGISAEIGARTFSRDELENFWAFSQCFYWNVIWFSIFDLT